MLSTHAEPYRVDPGPGSARDLPEQAVDVRSLWLAILAGRTRVFATACTPQWLYLELEDRPIGVPLPRECVAVIEQLMLGVASKVIAIERNCSPSTVTMRGTRALVQMGIRCSPGTVPAGLLCLANAARGQACGSIQAKLRPIQDNRQQFLLSIRRPDLQLIEELSPAERSIANMLLEARSHRQMAVLRASSTRTIANQIASLYRKLDVSGRIPLVIRLAQLAPKPMQ